MLSPVRVEGSVTWGALVIVPCHLLPRIWAIFHNPCEAVHLSEKSCFPETGLGQSTEGSIQSLIEASHTSGILVDTPPISFLVSGLRFKAIRCMRKQGPITVLPLLKWHVGSVSAL